MKSKPETKQFEPQKDPLAFIEGGDENRIEPPKTTQQTELSLKDKISKKTVGAKVFREQKVFRLPIDLINVLKREAYERSVEKGSRVTDTELLEQALKKYFKI